MGKFVFILFIAISIFAGAIQSHADDTALFTLNTPPDALIILDLSSSMVWPSAQIFYVSSSSNCSSGSTGAFYLTSGTGHTYQCDVTNFSSSTKWYSNSSCNDLFYTNNSHSGYKTACRRIDIAQTAIKSLLDYNQDGKVDCNDEAGLGIRMGYEQFVNCSPSNPTGCITMPVTLPNYSYQCTGSTHNYTDVLNAVNSATTGGNTPLAFSLGNALTYLNTYKSSDPAQSCRKTFVILVTDGDDTLACPPTTGDSTQTDQYKRRRETVAKAKVLADAGYKVFVVGVGANMPHYLRYTLNWAAYYGGTNNPLVNNSGNTNGYMIPSGSLYPSNITSCQSSSYSSHNLGDGLHYYATSNDPGEASLDGYAFISADASQLTTALLTISNYIQQASYSFTSPTVPSVRLLDKDFAYVSSFTPNNTPFWQGDLKAYQLGTDGTLAVDANGNPLASNLVWDAANVFTGVSPDSRNIYTYINGPGLDAFTTTNTNLTNAILGVTADQDRLNLINHMRGYNAYNVNNDGNLTEKRNWILGDIIHSNPVIVGAPSSLFEDDGFSGTGGFYQNNQNRTKVIIVGANDGMLHAFDAATGIERWAFIPKSLLKNLILMKSAHTYYVDSTPKVADVWFDDNGDNKKTANEWRTVLVCGLRKGGQSYFALDITDTLNPKYLWEFPNPNDPNYATILKDLGQSWSEPVIGRVKIGANEKWVAFIGGGYPAPDNGKAFFVVDMKTGISIMEFSKLPGMDKSLAAPPTAVDTNADGYINKVYIGDLKGQMWVFDVSNSDTTKWTGQALFKAPGNNPIYYPPAVALDGSGTPWVYFGTGDRENPTNLGGPAQRFYAVEDDGLGKYPRQENDLKDVTSVNTFSQDTTKKGWFIQLQKTSTTLEQVFSKPTVFNHLVYFTTYTYTTTSNPCSPAGTANLYTVEYLSGGGAFNIQDLSALSGPPSQRSGQIGTGVPSSPVISVDLKGKASVTTATTSAQVLSQKAPLKTNKTILYWREVTQ
jgi:hypothetical protein